MFRRVVVIGSFGLLAFAVVLAGTRGGATYTTEEVVQTFTREGYTLTEPGSATDDRSGWTGYAPLVGWAEGTFLFPGPAGQGGFYVFVARNDLVAKEFFEPLARAGGGSNVFDLLVGNVVVSSDASLTETGLSTGERRRIRAAMSHLDAD